MVQKGEKNDFRRPLIIIAQILFYGLKIRYPIFGLKPQGRPIRMTKSFLWAGSR